MRRVAFLLCLFILAALNATPSRAQPHYKEPSSTYRIRYDNSSPPRQIRQAGCGSASAQENDKSADVAVVEFGANGAILDSGQLARALDCITRARETNSNGAVVMVFVHGWRHDASWSDENFQDFRTVLLSLALREAERFRSGYRRVVGIFVGWPGGNITEFEKRYRIAEDIGRGSAIGAAIRDIVGATKGHRGNEALGSPLILVGHSMGAMMLQSAFDTLLERGEIGAPPSGADNRRCARVYEGDGVIGGFPDLVLLLNSATDSHITKRLMQRLQAKRLSKVVDCGIERFQAPLFISASSENDYATNWLFWAAKLGRRITDGNDQDLINHTLMPAGAHECPAIQGVPDFGQSWHCLRQPSIQNGRIAKISIDLPQARPERARDPCHLRYQFESSAKAGGYQPLWVFRVPSVLIDGHNDIFNGRSSLLIMGLIQISGSTMSVFGTYPAMFEAEKSSCTLAP